MHKDDVIRLRHMLDASNEAVGFARGRGRPDLDSDRMLALSIVRCIEIVGEAASKVSEDGRGRCPGIPWPEIVGMRNRLVHAYFEVDLDRVWDTVVQDLPPLIEALGKALAEPRS